eukprot:scaffold268417_cov17-Tisochrysis_lutea.AAC.1
MQMCSSSKPWLQARQNEAGNLSSCAQSLQCNSVIHWAYMGSLRSSPYAFPSAFASRNRARPSCGGSQ